MKYQLILQLPFSSMDDYHRMIEYEEAIIIKLDNLGYVDGHDAGSGEMNIFILTDNPELAFDRIKIMPDSNNKMRNMKAAFREEGTDLFTVIYPSELIHFEIK